ncbi:hypothetical protein ACRALDRAFT_212449 [Sodiomyces alcalophilus JCM 7366]|uniref:uncharacterized protein n=1 Tax=Sodiomyces alcalophilus JCM 7366 TaxID=591952 RepID=UPI0039B39628
MDDVAVTDYTDSCKRKSPLVLLIRSDSSHVFGRFHDRNLHAPDSPTLYKPVT